MPSLQFVNDFTEANFPLGQKDQEMVKQVRGLFPGLLPTLKS